MSARAASRLETLGFREIYRYQPGKADWFAAGLPREGSEAGTPRVGDIAERDVPTCRVDESVGHVRDRLRHSGADVCVVVDDRRVVLGLVEDVTGSVPAETPIEGIMRPGPVTFRPDVRAGRLPEYVKGPRTSPAIVTTSDGVLVGLLRTADSGRERAPIPRED